MQRRSFLKAACGAAAIVPQFVPGAAFGFGRPAPSNRVALGFIGLGWKGLRGCFGSLLRHFIDNPVSEPVVLCDVNTTCTDAARAVVAQRYGGRPRDATTDFREVVARRDVDAVVIATPDHWHALQTIWACRHGKDVYCEKPLSLTVREARAMADAARRYGRIVQTGNQSRSNVIVRNAMEVLQSGRIGRIREIHVACGGPSVPCNLPAQPQPKHIDWNMWLGPAPWRPYNEGIAHMGFRAFMDYSGGGMTDWGAHRFDLGQWALGMDRSGPVEIFPPGKDRPWLTYRYADGCEMYHNSTKTENGANFIGTEGTLWCPGLSAHVRSNPPGLCKPLKRQGGEDIEYNAQDHSDNFLECVRTRRPPNSDVETGCRTVTVCHLGNIAYWLGRRIRWDPVGEEIVGDPEAARWLDRAKREPWTLE